MIFGYDNRTIFLYTRPIDFRMSFDGLSAQVTNYMHRDPTSGDYYVFANKARDRLKILVFDRHGYWVLAKRLERGRFSIPGDIDGEKIIPHEELMCIIEGIDIRSAKRHKRYSLPRQSA